MITPEVMLLNIDQIANKAIPITAKTDEKTNDISLVSAPKTNDSIRIANRNNETVT